MSGGPSEPEKRFVLDIMLGRLAKWLRMLGFDAAVRAFTDPGMVESFLSGGLIAVTRREKFRHIEGVLFVESDRHFEQLREIVSKLGLDRDSFQPFTRCTLCNSQLHSVSREEAFGAVPDYVFETASDFRKCPKCSRIYWPGSHKERMLNKLEWMMENKQEERKNG